jgi:ribose 5-phosphate isomerase B
MDTIAIGSDHAGYSLKEAVKPYLAAQGLEVLDFGAEKPDPVDYPDFACRVAEEVSTGRFARGILVCGSGVGMSIAANKFPAVRAVLALDEETARMSRQHNDSNILVLAGRRTDPETANRIIGAWLTTPFEGGRHQKRLEKITAIERRFSKQ